MPKYNDIVYRGTHLSKKKFNELYLSHVGGVMEEKAFTSTSPSKDISMQFLSYDGIPKNHVKILFEIHGKNGRDISKISEFNGIFTETNQKEVLFDKGTKFVLKKTEIRNGIYEIRMEEL